jgi:cytochrome c oxidase subunit 2
LPFKALVLAIILFAGASAASAQEAQHIEITAKRFEYSPKEITVKKGQPVVLTIHSLDVSHGLNVKELHLQTKVEKGGTVDLPFTPTQTGTFVGHCSVFCGAGHGGMALTIKVTD